jgi:hypothetical protein
MKKFKLVILSMTILLIAAACSPTADLNAEDTALENGTAALTDENSEPQNLPEREFELPESTQLILGTLQLQTTAYPVSRDQAGALLPLWKGYRALSESDTTASEELEAVLKQISGILSTEQLNTIESVAFAPEDVRAMMEHLGIEFGSGAGAGAADGSIQRPGGDLPEGVRPGGGPGSGGETGLDPDQIATLQAEREANGGRLGGRGSGFANILIEPLIEMLEEIAQ